MSGITPEKLKVLCESAGIEVVKVRPNYLGVICDTSPMQKIRDAITADEAEDKAYQKKMRAEGAKILRETLHK